MRKYLLIAFIVFAINSNAQITLEHTYDSASAAPSSGISNQLMIVKFEISGDRYVRINNDNHDICIYNMSHSLQKTISFAGLPGISYSSNQNILYLSENLFDLDSNMEFMYACPTSINTFFTGIYNEDGSLIFSDTGAPIVKTNIPQLQYPIYNTSVGTKMILSYPNGQAKVFSLPGILSNSIAEFNNILLSQSIISNAYPNPTNNTTQIDYTLPFGINEGEIVFYDLQGNEVKHFRVDRTFNTLLISTTDIPAGTYYYQLQTTADNSEGKKLVVIK